LVGDFLGDFLVAATGFLAAGAPAAFGRFRAGCAAAARRARLDFDAGAGAAPRSVPVEGSMAKGMDEAPQR